MKRVAFASHHRLAWGLGLFACVGVACASPDTDDETGGSAATLSNNGGNSQNGGSGPQGGQGGSDTSTGGAPTTSNDMSTSVAPPTTTDQMSTSVAPPTTSSGTPCDELECLTMCFQQGGFGQCGPSGCECMAIDGAGGGTGSLLDSVGSFAGQGGSSSSFPSGGFGGAFPSGGFGGDIGFP